MANDRFAWCAVTHAATCQAMQASDSYKRLMRARCRCGRVDGDDILGDVVRVFHAGVSSKRLICSVCE